MKSDEIRSQYIDFFLKLKHKRIPPAPIVPSDDPTTLFTGFGMQQLVPYLKGEKHPMGSRLVNSQPCFRAEDIEEIGDNRHTTFFEMLGNWSLGDYFKAEQLPWFFQFLCEIVSLDPKRLYVTVFQGDASIPKDKESIKIWQELFKSKKPEKPGKSGFDHQVKIYSYSSQENWWSRSGPPESMPPGEIGGPDSEVFYDFGLEADIHAQSQYKNQACHLNCECGRFLEIGNSVFIQYEKKADGGFKLLPNKNVDFGGGLERIAAASQGKADVFQNDLLLPIIQEAEEVSGKRYNKQKNKPALRIISDHLRAASFIAAQGIKVSNKKQGYILRRLIRRALLKLYALGVEDKLVEKSNRICSSAVDIYSGIYINKASQRKVKKTVTNEVEKFTRLIKRGAKLVDKELGRGATIDSDWLFDLYQTHGLPLEVTEEMLAARGRKIALSQKQEFQVKLRKHQELSRRAASGMFKGGLADKSKATIKLHTATHLLHQALRQVLGDHVRQEGSNITAKRLRFDFTHSYPLSDDEIKKTEDLVNRRIRQSLPVKKTIENLDQALESGALAFFQENYPEKVSVYTIGRDPQENWFSKELCNGPHVESTAEIGGLQITREKAAAAGIRRIYARLKN